MPRLIEVLSAAAAVIVGAAMAQPAMNPTAPKKMMPPSEKARLEECQKMAAQQNIAMDQRAKFVMDCMKEKAK